VGDNLGDDVEGATFAGLRPVLIDTKGQHTELANPVPRIQRLAELPDVLSAM
jgi:FMN phosphatase YigB (HAD superfamily)